MAAYRDSNGKWYVSVYYDTWEGKRSRKVKRGFTTKRAALEWEREFLGKEKGDMDMTFASFLEIYKRDLKERLKLSTWVMKTSVIDQKILPYFKDRRMCEIKASDIIAWQNVMMSWRDENGKAYSPTYLKTIHNQCSAIFNHAVRFYDLKSNPAQKAGNMGKEKTREMLFWTKEEYRKFSDAMMDKPIRDNLDDLGIPEEALRGLLETVVGHVLENNLQAVLGTLDVQAVVEDKINAMDARELEDLVLSVMKNELQAIVNLGALIGAVIGIVNIFI